MSDDQTTYEEMRPAWLKEVDEAHVAIVKEGIAWLDEHVGPSWVDKIDLSRLNMGSATLCVLGQVFEDEAAMYEGNVSGWLYGTTKRYAPHKPFTVGAQLERAWRLVLRNERNLQ